MNITDKLRKLIHPILLKALPQKDFTVRLINEIPQIDGNKIYVMNHSNKHDAPVACEAIKEHVFILVGKQALEFMDRIFFFLNGVVYVERKDKESKRQGSKQMLRLLQRGNNLLIYPEGTWNMTPSKPMLPLNWGVIDLARNAEVPIIPLVAEYTHELCMVKFGEPIYIDHDVDKTEAIQFIGDVMATLKWEIWESLPIEKRSERLKDEFDLEMRKRVAEYPKLNLEYEMSVVRGKENMPEYVMGRKV